MEAVTGKGHFPETFAVNRKIGVRGKLRGVLPVYNMHINPHLGKEIGRGKSGFYCNTNMSQPQTRTMKLFNR